MAATKYGEKRVRRMANGETTQRSELDAGSVTRVLREHAAATLADEPEVTLILDGMELRRAGATSQEALMRVKALEGGLVNGYRSFNVLGLGEGAARGLVYHHLFSSQEAGFKSENREIQAAIEATEASLQTFTGPKTWVMDAGFDNDDVWWWVWGHGSHLVCRVYHFERIVEWQTPTGEWEERYLDATFKHLTPLATVETTLEVRLKGQRRTKRQPVTVHLSAVPIRVYAPGDKSRTKPVWIVKVEVEGAAGDPWYLLTDWPVTTEAEVVRIFRFYRRRWSVEDTFKFIKTCFGAEDVQMLHLEAIRRLVAYAWVAAGFLFHLGLTLDDTEVRLLARLGGWEPRADRPPGKLILTRGLRRLLDQLATEAILQDHLDEFGDLPPFVKRILARSNRSLLEH
jgi:hypothetical protein